MPSAQRWGGCFCFLFGVSHCNKPHPPELPERPGSCRCRRRHHRWVAQGGAAEAAGGQGQGAGGRGRRRLGTRQRLAVAASGSYASLKLTAAKAMAVTAVRKFRHLGHTRFQCTQSNSESYVQHLTSPESGVNLSTAHRALIQRAERRTVELTREYPRTRQGARSSDSTLVP